MKKFNKILKEVAAGVREEMRSSVEAGINHLSYEYDLSDCTIMVESHLVVCINGLGISDHDVWVARDKEHESPLVLNSIRKVLPDWVDVEREYEEQQKEFELEERYMMY